MALPDAEAARYARQVTLPGFGEFVQQFLRAARVHVVGAGAAAGPALLYLAQAGIGLVHVDDGADVAPEDAVSWLYSREQVGEPRLFAAIEAVKAANGFAKARAFATGADPTAVLICPESAGVAREAAERARLAGVPHVVAVADGDGGEVVSVPPAAPCYACASRPGTGAPPRAGASAAVGALGALELILILGGLLQGGGRRVDLVLGQPHARPTSRIPGCACGQGRGV